MPHFHLRPWNILKIDGVAQKQKITSEVIQASSAVKIVLDVRAKGPEFQPFSQEMFHLQQRVIRHLQFDGDIYSVWRKPYNPMTAMGPSAKRRYGQHEVLEVRWRNHTRKSLQP